MMAPRNVVRPVPATILLAWWLVVLPLAGVCGAQGPPAQAHSWVPPDIDSAVPPVSNEQPCPLPEVLSKTGARVKEFAVSLQRFAAREQIEYIEMEKDGRPGSAVKAKFSYVAYIREVRPGQFAVEEYRDDSTATNTMPTRLATSGGAAFALIFHPHYVKDFAVTCEGQASLDGKPAWQLRFQQERQNNFRQYRVANLVFPVRLKGRAWIDAATFQVLRLQTDLLEPIEKIVEREHFEIDYGMVDFPKRELQLWLPRQANIYLDYRGRRYHHKHSFSDFQLFWVDTDQKDKSQGR